MESLSAITFCFFAIFSSVMSLPMPNITNPGPGFLDMLLKSGQYEEFSKLLRIDDVNLVRPTEGRKDFNPMFNNGLKFGDILLPNKQLEQERQGIRFDKYGGSKWPRNRVPYAISSEFSDPQKQAIEGAIAEWNAIVKCVTFRPRRWWENDYIFFFGGNGCYSYLGRTGGQQPISIDVNGCLDRSTILHEMDHAVGFAHEQNRSDRDEYIKVLFENIPEEWRSQYEKTNSEDYGLQGNYDYYSVMHYPVGVPGTDKPAFEVLKENIDLSQIGNGPGLTETDIRKIRELYC